MKLLILLQYFIYFCAANELIRNKELITDQEHPHPYDSSQKFHISKVNPKSSDSSVSPHPPSSNGQQITVQTKHTADDWKVASNSSNDHRSSSEGVKIDQGLKGTIKNSKEDVQSLLYALPWTTLKMSNNNKESAHPAFDDAATFLGNFEAAAPKHRLRRYRISKRFRKILGKLSLSEFFALMSEQMDSPKRAKVTNDSSDTLESVSEFTDGPEPE